MVDDAETAAAARGSVYSYMFFNRLKTSLLRREPHEMQRRAHRKSRALSPDYRFSDEFRADPSSPEILRKR